MIWYSKEEERAYEEWCEAEDEREMMAGNLEDIEINESYATTDQYGDPKEV